MSHFYGTVEGSRGVGTRCGTKASGMLTYCASWQGAVRCKIEHDEKTGIDRVTVSLVTWQGAGTSLKIYEGPVGGPVR